jgi:hypothetical protein
MTGAGRSVCHEKQTILSNFLDFWGKELVLAGGRSQVEVVRLINLTGEADQLD